MTDDRPKQPSWRPFVSLNVAESADGKIAPVGHGKVNFGSAEDRALMESLRALADGVLIGGGTLRAEDPSLIIRNPDIRARRIATKGSPHPRNMTVCSTLPEQLGEMKFFREPETEKIIFTTDRNPAEVLQSAAKLAHVEVVPLNAAGRVDLTELVRRLPGLGVQHLLLEGGGELNFSMLEAGLVDEVYLTLCPFLFGGRTAPTGVDGEGFPRDAVRKLALKSHRASSSGEIFLQYEVLADRPQLSASKMFPNGFDMN